ncbi:MAG: hypothetical protein AABZ60_15075 [Planctomycetota bacterium]
MKLLYQNCFFSILALGFISLNWAQSDMEVEKEVESAIVNGFHKDPRALQKNLDFFKRLDQHLSKTGKKSGLIDNIRDLQINLISDYSEAIQAKKELLNEDDIDPILQKRLEYHLELDPLLYIQTLEGEGFYNKIAALFNDVSQYAFLLASGNFFAVGNTAIDVFFTLLTFPQLTIHQRKILVLLEDHLKKQDPEFKETNQRNKLRQLQSRRQTLILQEDLDELEKLRDGQYWKAFESLLIYMKKTYSELEVQTVLSASEKDLLNKERQQKRSLFVETKQESISPEQEEVIEQLLEWMYSKKWEKASQYILQSQPLFQGSVLEDELWYLQSVLIEKQQGRVASIQFLQKNPYPESNMGKQAHSLLKQIEYHREFAIDQARSQHTWDTLHYVFTGQIEGRSAFKILSKRILSQGADAGASLGIFYAASILLRSIRLCFSNPISTQGIIDAYLKALEYEEDEEMRQVLIGLYESQEEYEKALYHLLKTTSPDPEKRKELEQEIQEKWLDLVEKLPDPEVQEKILQKILLQKPDLETEQKTRKKLEEVQLLQNKEYQFSWKILATFPELMGWLNLSPELVDNEGANGELDEQGVYLLKSGELLLFLEGNYQRRVLLSLEAQHELKAQLQQWKFKDTLKEQTYHLSPYGYFPLELYGSVGSQGVLVYPRLKQKFYANPDQKLYK